MLEKRSPGGGLLFCQILSTFMKNLTEMKKVLILAALVLAAFTAFLSCGQQAQTPDTRYASYVKAYTGNVVTQGSTIKVALASPATSMEDGLFSFSPSIKGSQRWISSEVVEFVPEQGQLKPGETYKCSFKLGSAADVEKGLEKFAFSFAVAPKKAMLEVRGVAISADNPALATILGRVKTSEAATEAQILDMLPKGAEVSAHEDDATLFDFVIQDIARGTSDKEETVTLKDGEFKAGDKIKVTIPGTDTPFRVLSAKKVSSDEQVIEVLFSEPFSTKGDWPSMFYVDGVGKAYIDAKGNIAWLYYENPEEEITIGVSENLKSINDARLGSYFETRISRGQAKPAVKIPLSGNILPDASSLVLPFKAVNLRAVDVRVIKIYEDNVLMFLQDNSLNGDDNLRRAGRLVWENTVSLENDPSKDLHEWNDFALDLTDMFKKEKGAIYRIRISFNQDYSIYGKQYVPGQALHKISAPVTDSEVWDTPNPYYWEGRDWSEYDWDETDNPDHPSYYIDYNYPEVNLMTSDLGLTAKYSGGDKLWLAASDIMDAKPVSADVEAYNFQLRKIGAGKISGTGELQLSGKPFAVVARHGGSTTYLKVTEGYENSLSRFDVGGETLQKGLKASIYGERGVWRPGDTLHLTMILQGDKIPEDHPATLEIYTPEGQFYGKYVRAKGVNGFYCFDVPTLENDPTGFWNAYFKVGGASFHKALRVESIKPNRLKVDIDLGGKEIRGGSRNAVTVVSSWLTGPAAAGLQAKAYMALNKGRTTFKGYESYVFDNPLSSFSASENDILDTRLDGSGKSVTIVDMPSAKDAPGKLSATVVCSVLEEGGDASFTTVTVPFSPFRAYVGVEIPKEKDGYLFTDKDNTIKVVLLDEEGKPVTGHNMEYQVYRIDWSWWWENGQRSLSSYVNSSSSKVYASGRFVSGNGPSTFTINVPEKEWGRYLIYVKDRDGGHASGLTTLIDWPSYQGRGDHKDPTAVNMLSFSLDKKSYAVGETATVYIPEAPDSRALVSLENGSGVISQKWVETGKDFTTYTFKVTEEMTPNFYVYISLVRPHEKTADGAPIRLYGVQPVMVENPGSHLEPVLSVADAVHPEEQFTVKVSEKHGKPMTYTLAIVDEGLLDITGFKTPDPWNDMYRREALGVRTWDIYDDIIGGFGGAFSSMLGIGGDEGGKILGAKKDNRFNPVVKFMGPFTLSGKSNTHDVKLPMYVGSVRVMLVAGQDGAYGNAEKAVAVRSPLMVVPTLPRVISIGEDVTLPVNVFALEDGVKNATVTVKVDGPVKINGSESATVSFDKPSDKLLRFALRTTGEGLAHVTVSASGNGQKASETIAIEVRNPNPAITSVQTVAVKPGTSMSMTYAPAEQATLELASFPAFNFDENFRYFKGYGYSCTEQLAAKGISLVFTREFLSEENRAEADKAIPEVLKELYSRQLADGGFAYWPGYANASTWPTSMVGVFLGEAAAKGFDVNKNVLNKWHKFQNNASNNFRKAGDKKMYDLDQAYRLYSLALAGKPDNAGMNRLKESPDLSAQARWMLASAYSACGKKDVAKSLTDTTAREFRNYSPDDLTFGSSARDKAIVIEALTLQDDVAGALEAASSFVNDFNRGYASTQLRAFASTALSRLAKKVNAGPLDAELTVGGKKDKVNTSNPNYSVALDPKAGNVVIANNSQGAVYASVLTVTKAAEGEITPARANGLSIKVSYEGTDGTPLNPASIRQGTDFFSRVTVTNTSPTETYSNLALTQILPSGWEIYNERLTGTVTASGSGYNDVRDDRSLWFFDLGAGVSRTFTLRLRAAYEGVFVLPAVKCEAMYDSSVSANTVSGKAAVTR